MFNEVLPCLFMAYLVTVAGGSLRPTDASECIGMPFGYSIPDRSDCLSYFLCQGTKAIVQYCEYGKVFSAEQQQCIVGKCPWCGVQPTSTPGPDPDEPDCTLYNHGDIIPHKVHCRLFWQCVTDTAVLRFCEIGQWFDRDNFVCNFPNQIKNCPANQD